MSNQFYSMYTHRIESISLCYETVTLVGVLPVVVEQSDLGVQPNLASLLDEQPVTRHVVRPLHHLRHVHELEQLPRPERDGRAVGVNAGVQLRRLVPRGVALIAVRKLPF
jgi:hypothetical protein